MIYRLPLLRARNELDSWLSREAAFLANNWILLFSRVLRPVRARCSRRSARRSPASASRSAAPFFNQWMAPIGLILLFLTGIGPLLAWRKSTLENLRDQFLWPVIAASSRWPA